MRNKKNIWLTIALVNLCIVALLGVTLRSKILFPLQGIDFTHILHAHSHYAFTGWITLALMTLMIYEILPAPLGNKKIYTLLLEAVLLNSLGMLISFICQGYAFYSILFSTLFVFVTYAFSFIFIRDLLKSKTNTAVTILSISALICLVLSSAGPFTLAYLMASHSVNNLLYRDSVYTYLHLQYNGFFTLAVFALFINNLCKAFNPLQLKLARKLAIILSISILPTLFISYLWHYPDEWLRDLSISGCISIILVLFYLYSFLKSIKDVIKTVPRFTRNIALLSVIAFILKSLLQTGTIIPSLGRIVYGDRAIIIGFLHLVLLGFITLYLLSHLLHISILNPEKRFTKIAILTFAGAVIINEVILMVQGFGNMLMLSISIYAWLLWGVSIWLLMGAVMILLARIRTRSKR